MKYFLIPCIAISMVACDPLAAQDARDDSRSLLGQNLRLEKELDRGDRLDRPVVVQQGLAKLPHQGNRARLAIPSAQQQKDLKKFVREHHGELIRLLNWLEKNRPEQYRNAIKSLAVGHDRLMAIQERDPQRFESALEQWKLRSRIKFAAAQMVIKDSPRYRNQLEDLIRKQFELRAEQLKQEEQRLGQRLGHVRSQLERINSNLDAAVQREMRIAVRQANRMKQGSRDVNKPNKKTQNPSTKDNGS